VTAFAVLAPGTEAAVCFIGSWKPIGMACGATRTVLTAPASTEGTDISWADTTCSTPPRGRLSSSLACTADCACATVPVAEIVNALRLVTARPDWASQALTAFCWAAVAPNSACTWAGER
jgi:hypothetical protein